MCGGPRWRSASPAPVSAQGVLVGTEAIDDRITDIRSDVRDELAEGRDAQRFGFGSIPQGPSGSLSFGLNAASGNTDTTDVATAGRLRYGAGGEPVLDRLRGAPTPGWTRTTMTRAATVRRS